MAQCGADVTTVVDGAREFARGPPWLVSLILDPSTLPRLG
jgi:hypothetical protein